MCLYGSSAACHSDSRRRRSTLEIAVGRRLDVSNKWSRVFMHVSDKILVPWGAETSKFWMRISRLSTSIGGDHLPRNRLAFVTCIPCGKPWPNLWFLVRPCRLTKSIRHVCMPHRNRGKISTVGDHEIPISSHTSAQIASKYSPIHQPRGENCETHLHPSARNTKHKSPFVILASQDLLSKHQP